MVGPVVRHALIFLLLVFLQVLAIDNINPGDWINPYIYVLFILILPFSTPQWLILVSAFFLGITIDIFHYSPGMHAAACVLAGFIRTFYFRMMPPEEEPLENQEPHLHFPGLGPFLVYSSILVFSHHLLLFTIQTFGTVSFGNIFLRSLLNTGASLLVIWLFDLLFFYDRNAGS